MKISKYLIDLIIVFSILFFALYLGKTYSIYHTDPWHWGSIAGITKDYINGFELFKDIVLLFGPGQPFLYNIINKFYTINYYSIGIITTIVHTLNLFLIYIILLNLSNRLIALVIFLFIFCLVPYPQVPWPDFYSGLCLTISCFFLTVPSKEKNIYLFISALFLVLCIGFRNSYIVTILPAFLLYILIYLFHKNKIPVYFKKFFFYFFILILISIFTLWINNNLILWYEQGLGRVGEYKNLDSSINGFKINESLFLLVKFIYHIFIPTRLENFYFLLILASSFFLILSCLIKKNIFLKIINKNDKIFFFVILGIFGSIQSFNQYEIWRHLNSSISLFFALGYFLKESFNDNKYFKIPIALIIIFCVTIFPLPSKNGYKHLSGTNYFPLRGFFIDDKFMNNQKLYSESNISFFNGHLFNEDHINYYNELKKIICNYQKIINYSIDRNIGYICEDKNLIISTYPKNNSRPVFHKPNLEFKYSQLNLDDNEVLIADKKFSNPNIKFKKKIYLPKYTRYTYADTIMKYFDKDIYIYVKK